MSVPFLHVFAGICLLSFWGWPFYHVWNYISLWAPRCRELWTFLEIQHEGLSLIIPEIQKLRSQVVQGWGDLTAPSVRPGKQNQPLSSSLPSPTSPPTSPLCPGGGEGNFCPGSRAWGPQLSKGKAEASWWLSVQPSLNIKQIPIILSELSH